MNPLQLEIDQLRQELQQERESRKKAENAYQELVRLRHENPNPILRFDERGALLSANAASLGLVNLLLDGWEVPAVATVREQVRESALTRNRIKSTFAFNERVYDFFTVPFENQRYVNAYFFDTTEREKAERSLKETQYLVQRITNTIPHLVCLVDVETLSIVFHNDQLEKVTGYSIHDFQTQGNQLITSLFHADAHSTLSKHVQELEALEDGHVHESTHRILHKNGEWRWTRVRSVSFTRNEDGSLKQVLITAEDKTEKVELNKQLEQQKDFYENILHKLPETIAVFDKDFRYLFVNHRTIQNPEIRKAIIGKNDFEYCTQWKRPSAIADVRWKRYQEAASLKSAVEWEEELETPMGQKVHYIRRISPVMDTEGEIKYLIGSGFDITQRKNNENKIRLFHSVVDHTKDGIVIVELGKTLEEDKMVYVNPAFSRISLHHAEEVIGQSPAMFLSPLLDPSVTERLTTAYQNREALDAEFLNFKKDGAPYWLNISLAPTIDPAGKATHFVIGLRDITERKTAEEKIKQTAQKNKAIIQAIPDSLLVVDRDGIIRDKNEVGKSLPLLPSQQRGDCLFHAAPADLKEKIGPLLTKALDSGSVEIFEYDLPQGQGFLNYELRLIGYKEGEVLLIIRDITQKKKSLMELQEQKEFIRQVLDTNPNFIFVKDGNGRFLLANQAKADLLETPLDKINEQNMLLMRQNPQESEQFIQDDRQVIASGQDLEKEEVFTTPSGKQILLHTIKKPILRADGSVQVLGISTDITEIKQAKEDLKKREALYRLLSENSRDIICLHNLKGDYTYISRSMQDILGFSPKELIGTSPFQYIHPDDHDRVLDHLNQTLPNSLVVTDTLRFQNRNGNYVWLETILKLILDEQGQPLHLQSASREVTERKKAEEIILQSEKRYRNLVNYSQAIICSHDLQGRIISVNPSLQRILGYSEAEIINTSIQDYLPASHRRNFDQYLAALADNNQKDGITCVIDRSGKRKYLLSQAFKVEEQEMTPYIITFAQDITDRLIAENELKKAKIAAEESARAKENFLANMSHEIRTPMNGVIGMTGLLGKTPLTETQESYVKNIRISSQNLLVIINDILDMAKIESGKMELEQIPFNLVDTLKAALASQAYRAEEKDLVLTLEELPANNSNLIGDPYRLHQVLLNLLSNAIKFTEKGTVALSCRFMSESNGKAAFSFTVRDTGIGVPEGKQQVIFDGFTQAYASTSRKYGGTGLGLTICKRLIERQGGRIWVNSKAGEGSEFSFILPFALAQEPILQEPERRNLEYSALAGNHILLAEDNEINQFLAKAILESWGCVVQVAPNGQDAVRYLEQGNFDLVLMDIQMPVMNGLEATQAIRNHPNPQKARIPVIALTANALKGEEEKYLAAGMNGYLSKPFEEEQLFLILSTYLLVQPVSPADPGWKPMPPEANNTMAPPTPEPVKMDFAPLKKMCAGDLGFYTKMLQLFLELVPVYVSDINKYAEQEDWQTVGSLAHKLKPNIDTLALEELKGDIRLLEQYGKQEKHLSEIPGLVWNLSEILGRALIKIQEELTNTTKAATL